MTDERSGLCLGGPKDGQFMSIGWTTFEAHQRLSPMAPLMPGEMVATSMSMTTVTYRHVKFLDQGFWLPVEDLARAPLADVILKHLVSGYRRPLP